MCRKNAAGMDSKNMSFKIIGTGKGIPKRSVSNYELSSFLDTNDEWITTRTGIKNRYVCVEESLTDLAETAAMSAIKKALLKKEDIDLIICSTISGDYVTPSLACAVAEKLRISCPAFDINAACAGFIYAFDIAALYLKGCKAKNILIISAEMMSKHVDWNDRKTCVLFGDGAGACVVTHGNALKYINLTLSADTEMINLSSHKEDNPFVKAEKNKTEFLHMQGQDVFKFAVTTVEKEAQLAFEALSIAPKDIDYFLLHQANKRIIDSIRRRFGQKEDKFPVNIDKYANMSSATIPILLDEMLAEGRIKPGDTLFLSAFGAGMTAGSCVIVWE